MAIPDALVRELWRTSWTAWAPVIVCAFSVAASGQDAPSKAKRAPTPPSPYGALDAAAKLGREMSPVELGRIVAHKRAYLLAVEQHRSRAPTGHDPDRAFACLFLAELQKRIGDYEAPAWYERAIAADPDPAYSLFYGDYWRVYRGAHRPNFARAEAAYFQAAERLRVRAQPQTWDDETNRRLRRQMIALYERDGLTNGHTYFARDYRVEPPLKPLTFMATLNTWGVGTTDLPEVDDARELSAEAEFMMSGLRLNRPLTESELASLVRSKPQFETTQRLRVRPGYWPVVDLAWRNDHLERAQVTSFFAPRGLSDVDTDDVSVALSSPWTWTDPDFDGWTSVGYRRLRRVGTIEFLPEVGENIDQIEATAAVSRAIGPDRLLWESTIVNQQILGEQESPPMRDRWISATQLRYFLYRQTNREQTTARGFGDYRFEPRGWEFYGGALWDVEGFGATDVLRHDYFLGTAVRGVNLNPDDRRWVRNWDFLVQATVFDSAVDTDPSQQVVIYRTTALVLARLKDQEEPPNGDEDLWPFFYPAFIHVAAPLRWDLAPRGTSAFENYSAGLQLFSKLYSTRLGGVTSLVSGGYTHQHFYRVGQHVDLVEVSLNLGF